MKEYLKSEYPDLEDIYDELSEDGIGYAEIFLYDGEKYNAHIDICIELGIKSSYVIIKELII
jgi:hypothetical protein